MDFELENKPLYFLGDHHGEYQAINNIIKHNDMKDCYILHVGDGGEGFIPFERKQQRQYEYHNNFFKGRGIRYFSIRGNHSNPEHFKGNVNLSNFTLLEDYSVLTYNNKTIQLIGGAISLDRVYRKQGVSYWEDEPINFDAAKCKEVDVLITHSAPNWCFPYGLNNDIVKRWCSLDSKLLQDLTEERELLAKVFDLCKPSVYAYGHFHMSHIEHIKNCVCKALAINEFWDPRI